MEILPPSPENIKQAVAILRAGGTVAHATETCYGLACDLQNRQAIQELFKLKQRPETMPVSALFESIDQAKQYVEWNELANQLAHEHLPGPLTLVLPMKHEKTLFPTPQGSRTVGIRVSPHPTAVELVRAFGSPISTTSANIHGEPNSYSPTEIASQFRKEDRNPDLLLDSGSLPEEGESSTVVDISCGTVEILRPGHLNL